jgi:cyclophilin family peptidyl-prolyl cis-trans isomerase
MRLGNTLFFLFLLSLPGLAKGQAPAAPTGVVAFAPNENRAHLSWVDNATDETAYWVDRFDPDAVEEEVEWVPVATLPANFELVRLDPSDPVEPETHVPSVRYRVAAVKEGVPSDWVEATVEIPEGSLNLAANLEGSEARVGVPFTFSIPVSGGVPDSYSIADPPAGLSFNESTGEISGTINTPGVYRMFTGVVFDEGKKFEQIRYLRVLPSASAPVVARPDFVLPTQNVGVRGFLDIAFLFADPKRPSGALFRTPLGDFTVALFDQATPKTVNNFLGYMRRRDYDNSYVHRSIPGFMIQSGGARPASTTASPTQWSGIPGQPVIQNESGTSNRRGTIAMARSSAIDSATSEWFLTTGEEEHFNLDFQNGGFAAFGEVIGSAGMAVVDGLNSLQRRNYTGIISGAGVNLLDVPVFDLTAPATPGPNSLVLIEAVEEVPPLLVQLVSNSNPSVLNASVSGMDLFLESLGPIGATNLHLRATNFDGNTVDFVMPIRIDDVESPGVGLTSLKGKGRSGILVKGLAADNLSLASWKYRINRGKWKNGGRLSGPSAKFSRVLRGFKRGKNLLEIQSFDSKGNVSTTVKQRFTLN